MKESLAIIVIAGVIGIISLLVLIVVFAYRQMNFVIIQEAEEEVRREREAGGFNFNTNG